MARLELRVPWRWWCRAGTFRVRLQAGSTGSQGGFAEGQRGLAEAWQPSGVLPHLVEQQDALLKAVVMACNLLGQSHPADVPRDVRGQPYFKATEVQGQA